MDAARRTGAAATELSGVFDNHGSNGLADLSACNAQADTDDTEEYEVF
jgi:hypothetical protein